MHDDQLFVGVAAVRRLVHDQFPQWAGLPVVAVESTGTVNAIFRIGDGMVARFALQPAELSSARRSVTAEVAAARRLAGRSRFATPRPIAVGAPGAGYPLPWLVQTWLPGTVATERDPSGSDGFARDLAEFVTQVRGIDTEGRTCVGTHRGGDLPSHDDWVQECTERSHGLLDVAWLRRTWTWLRTLPRTSLDVMAHGDLTPGNLLVEDDRLIGVLDVGGLGPADPALDLVVAWLAPGWLQIGHVDVPCPPGICDDLGAPPGSTTCCSRDAHLRHRPVGPVHVSGGNMRQSFRAVSFAALAAVVVVTGCSSSTKSSKSTPSSTSSSATSSATTSAATSSATTSASAPSAGSSSVNALLGKAKAAFVSAPSVRVSGGTTEAGKKEELDLSYARGGASGSVTLSGTQIRFVVLGSEVYFNAPDAYWKKLLASKPSALKKVEGKWVKAPSTATGFSQIAQIGDRSKYASVLFKPTGAVTTQPAKTVNGVACIGLKDQMATLYLAKKGSRPIETVQTSGPGKVTFTYTGVTVPKAPPAAETVSISQLK